MKEVAALKKERTLAKAEVETLKQENAELTAKASAQESYSPEHFCCRNESLCFLLFELGSDRAIHMHPEIWGLSALGEDITVVGEKHLGFEGILPIPADSPGRIQK